MLVCNLYRGHSIWLGYKQMEQLGVLWLSDLVVHHSAVGHTGTAARKDLSAHHLNNDVHERSVYVHCVICMCNIYET